MRCLALYVCNSHEQNKKTDNRAGTELGGLLCHGAPRHTPGDIFSSGCHIHMAKLITDRNESPGIMEQLTSDPRLPLSRGMINASSS